MARADKFVHMSKAMDEMSKSLKAGEISAEEFARAIAEANNQASAFATSLHTIFDIQGMINAGYKTGTQAGGGSREATTTEHDEDIARRFENLENELKQAFGKDNFAAATIDNVVKGLRAGVLTPNQAMDVVRGVLGPYFSGGQLFGDLGNPDPEIRKVAEEMMRLLASGNLNP
jgi:hypothetical protein